MHPLTSAARPGPRLVTSWIAALLLAVSPALGEAAGSADDATGSADDATTEQGDGESTTVEPPEREERVTATSLTQTMDADSGVSVQTLCTNCNNADLSMGGLDNDHVAVTCDGLPVPSGLAQVYLLSIMPPTVIDKVSVKKGASETQLPGGAVGGGIEIERRAPEPGLDLNVSSDYGDYGWTGTRFDVAGQSGRFGGTLVGSWAKSDAINANADTPVVGGGERQNYDLPKIGERSTVDGSLQMDFGRKQRIRVGGTVYDESQEDGPAAYDWFSSMFSPTPVYERENVELERRQVDGLYEADYSEGSHLEVSLVWAERSQDIEETEFSTSFVDTYFIDDEQLHAGASWSRAMGQRGRMRAGVSYAKAEYGVVDVRFNQFSLALPPDEAAQFTLDENVEEWGVWVEGEAALGGKVDLSAGLRFVAFDYTDNEALLAEMQPAREPWLGVPLPDGDRLLPRAALTWKPVDALSLRFSGGSGFRAPEPIYDEVCCGRRYRNNRGVATEKSESYGIEATFQPTPEFRLGASAFLTDFEDRIVRMASLAYFSQSTIQNMNVPEARYRSLSLDTRWQPSVRFSFKASASWVEADNETPGNVIPVLIDFFNAPVYKEFVTAAIPFTAERRAAVGVNFRMPRATANFGITGQYTGPMLVQEYIQDFMTNPDLGFSEVQFDSFVSTPDFIVVNVNFSKGFKNGMTLFAGVDNIGDYVQEDLGDPTRDHNWGPLRGRYSYAGLSYHFDSKGARGR